MPTVSKKQEKFMQAVANNPEFAKKVGVNQSIGREFIKGKDMKKNYMYGGKVKKMNMGGRTGDMMYSRGYGVDKKGKRMPTELMTAPGMKKGGKVKKGTSTDYKGQVGDILYNKVRKNVKKSTGPQKNVSAMTSTRMRADNKAKKGPVASRLYDAEEKMKNRYKTGSKNVKSKVMEMNMGGPTARTKRIMNEKDEIRRVDKEIRKNEGYKDGGKVKAFKAHMMYDKKTGKAVKAPTKAKHLELKKKGYGHTKKMMMGGKVKGYKKGGAVSSASKRADGIATKGHTRGRMV